MPEGTTRIDASANNMVLWDRVSVTDPHHTKPVKYGTRQFTSVDAMYQVQRATDVFGPVGKGWGYEVDYSTLAASVMESKSRPAGEILLQFADVTIWWKEDGERHEYGPVRACNLLTNANGNIDEDAPKKAMTDALTKALSHLGFSADVFLGRYDDDKYVARLRQEFTDKRKQVDDAIPASLHAMAKDLTNAINEDELKKHYDKNLALIKKQSEANQRWIRLKYREHADKLVASQPPADDMNQDAGQEEAT